MKNETKDKMNDMNLQRHTIQKNTWIFLLVVTNKALSQLNKLLNPVSKGLHTRV